MNKLKWIDHDGSWMDIQLEGNEGLALIDTQGNTSFWFGLYNIYWEVVTAYCKFNVQDILPPYEKKRWRAQFGELYYYVTDIGSVFKRYDEMGGTDNLRYSAGNYFSSRQEAKASKIYQAFERESQ